MIDDQLNFSEHSFGPEVLSVHTNNIQKNRPHLAQYGTLLLVQVISKLDYSNAFLESLHAC